MGGATVAQVGGHTGYKGGLFSELGDFHEVNLSHSPRWQGNNSAFHDCGGLMGGRAQAEEPRSSGLTTCCMRCCPEPVEGNLWK